MAWKDQWTPAQRVTYAKNRQANYIKHLNAELADAERVAHRRRVEKTEKIVKRLISQGFTIEYPDVWPPKMTICSRFTTESEAK